MVDAQQAVVEFCQELTHNQHTHNEKVREHTSLGKYKRANYDTSVDQMIELMKKYRFVENHAAIAEYIPMFVTNKEDGFFGCFHVGHNQVYTKPAKNTLNYKTFKDGFFPKDLTMFLKERCATYNEQNPKGKILFVYFEIVFVRKEAYTPDDGMYVWDKTADDRFYCWTQLNKLHRKATKDNPQDHWYEIQNNEKIGNLQLHIFEVATEDRNQDLISRIKVAESCFTNSKWSISYANPQKIESVDTLKNCITVACGKENKEGLILTIDAVYGIKSRKDLTDGIFSSNKQCHLAYRLKIKVFIDLYATIQAKCKFLLFNNQGVEKTKTNTLFVKLQYDDTKINYVGSWRNFENENSLENDYVVYDNSNKKVELPCEQVIEGESRILRPKSGPTQSKIQACNSTYVGIELDVPENVFRDAEANDKIAIRCILWSNSNPKRLRACWVPKQTRNASKQWVVDEKAQISPILTDIVTECEKSIIKPREINQQNKHYLAQHQANCKMRREELQEERQETKRSKLANIPRNPVHTPNLDKAADHLKNLYNIVFQDYNNTKLSKIDAQYASLHLENFDTCEDALKSTSLFEAKKRIRRIPNQNDLWTNFFYNMNALIQIFQYDQYDTWSKTELFGLLDYNIFHYIYNYYPWLIIWENNSKVAEKNYNQVNRDKSFAEQNTTQMVCCMYALHLLKTSADETYLIAEVLKLFDDYQILLKTIKSFVNKAWIDAWKDENKTFADLYRIYINKQYKLAFNNSETSGFEFKGLADNEKDILKNNLKKLSQNFRHFEEIEEKLKKDGPQPKQNKGVGGSSAAGKKVHQDLNDSVVGGAAEAKSSINPWPNQVNDSKEAYMLAWSEDLVPEKQDIEKWRKVTSNKMVFSFLYQKWLQQKNLEVKYKNWLYTNRLQQWREWQNMIKKENEYELCPWPRENDAEYKFARRKGLVPNSNQIQEWTKQVEQIKSDNVTLSKLYRTYLQQNNLYLMCLNWLQNSRPEQYAAWEAFYPNPDTNPAVNKQHQDVMDLDARLSQLCLESNPFLLHFDDDLDVQFGRVCCIRY